MSEPTTIAGAESPAPVNAGEAAGSQITAAGSVTALLQQIAAMNSQPLMLIEESWVIPMAMRGTSAKKIDEGYRASVQRADNADQTDGYGYVVDANGIAVFNISGTITPLAFARGDGTETISEWIECDAKAALNDPNVRGALFVINSPGGYVIGGYEVAEALAALTAAKPTATFISGHGTSLAYLFASQTGYISAYKTAQIGSIGTRSALIDAEQMFRNFGLTVVPIDSGGVKSAGLLGTKITDEQKAYFKERTVKLNQLFLDDVGVGRKMTKEQVAAVSDARVYNAKEAVPMKLIDSVGTLDEAYASLQKRLKPKQSAAARQDDADGANPAAQEQAKPVVAAPPQHESTDSKDPAMAEPQTPPAENKTAPKAATIPELRKQFPDDPIFAMDCAERGLTMTEAKAAYSDVLIERNKKLQEEAKAPKKPGATAVPSGRAAKTDKEDEGGYSGNAKADFDAAVRKEMSTAKCDRKTAIKAVAHREPSLHQAYLESTQPSRKQRELVVAKYDDRDDEE